MSSFVRRLQRQILPTKHSPIFKDGKLVGWGPAPARSKFFGGRASRLGVVRPDAPKPNSLPARGSRRKTKFRPFRIKENA